MDAATRQLIEAIHRAPAACVLALTGGGTAAAGALLSVPGGSRTVLEIVVPYHEHALVEFLGRRPEQFCSAATSRDMARRALERARWLTPGAAVVGVGCTASLATDRPKRGEHRFHITADTGERQTTCSLTLTKGSRDREGEEAVLDAVLLNALAEAVGVADRLVLPLQGGETPQVSTLPAKDPLAALARGETDAVLVDVDGKMRSDAPPSAVVLPGAFNPAHHGHWGLAEVAAQLLGRPAAFELSVVNVDKPPLAAEETRRRVAQFTWRAPLWLTRAPTFAEKSALFRGATFVVGADTAARIVRPRYYGDSEERLHQALGRIRERGCRFLVAGREDAGGAFVGLDELAIPVACRDLFTGIPPSAFRVAVSSTALREGRP
jgi:nicotinamide mononucleotide (NMN) deamidase PncC